MKNRRLRLFLILVPSTLAFFYGYLGWRLAGNAFQWIGLALPFLSVFLYIFLIRLRDRKKSRAVWLFTELAFLNMGLVSFLLVAALARDLLGMTTKLWVGNCYVLGAALLALFIASLRGRFGPSVKHVTLKYEALPSELDGFRIAQISDLHVSASIGLAYVSRVVRKTKLLQPQMIAFTGDIGDGRIEDLQAELESLAPITQSGARVFYVPGNHEVYWNLEAWLRAFRQMGMCVLLNENEVAKFRNAEIFIAGITDPAFAMIGANHAPDLKKASQGMERAPFKLLLSHRPDSAEPAAALGYDLQLSGHTHGGQFFPWTIVAGLVHRYSLGAYRLGKMWLYVSAGTGSWGPLLRLGTRAEITLITLRPQPRPIVPPIGS